MKTKKEIDEMLEKIGKQLIKFNFNVNSIGINYWTYAVYYIIRNTGNFDMMNIYNNISEIYKMSRMSVERAMRHSAEQAKDTIKQYFEYEGKLTNKGLLKLLYMYFKRSELYDNKRLR